MSVEPVDDGGDGSTRLRLWTVRRQLTDGGWLRWAPDATTLLVSVFAESSRLPWSGYDEEVTSRAGWKSSPWALPEDDADRTALRLLLAGRKPAGGGASVSRLARHMQRWSRVCRTAGAGDQQVLSDLHRALVRFGVLTDTGLLSRRTVGLGEVANVLDVLPLTEAERAEEEQAQRGEPPRIHRQRSVADR
ncbi:hypothetical protein GCM10009765_55280 [Fodinicola feengrottensis]|uniref:Uncharacterized protein n=1 Tax=Fodinicola feengrottensis TaxID=435914 RepID=A0ABN2I539_9ACTN